MVVGCFFLRIFLTKLKLLYFIRNFVPISLLVTLEMVKFFQGIRIINDKKMISFNQQQAKVQSSSLNEELGQVEYIFADKTGTLTCNIMEFKNICVDSVNYGDKKPENQLHIQKIIPNVNFNDPDFLTIINDEDHEKHKKCKEAVIVCCICNEVIAEEKNSHMIYTVKL